MDMIVFPIFNNFAIKKFYSPQMNVCRSFRYMIGANYNSTIQLCFFAYLNSIDDGGAMLIDQNFHRISVEESHFFHCEASNSGVAIYLRYWKCDISILRCCASYCMIQHYKGHFCFLNTSNLIQINDTSIIYNGGAKNNETCTSFLYKADTRVMNTNTSKNVAVRYSCLVYENSLVSTTAYSLFIENNSTESGNIFFYTYIGYSEHSFSNCIVAKNRIQRFNFPSGVVKIQSNVNVMNTLFEKNSDPFLLPYNNNFKIFNQLICRLVFFKTQHGIQNHFHKSSNAQILISLKKPTKI